jgi:hypothetical protein
MIGEITAKPISYTLRLAAFLTNHPGEFKLISQTNLLPSETGHDGFHASLLEKL